MSDASREADGYEVERSSADQHTAGEQGAENDAAVCASCGATIRQQYSGTFWKAPAPVPMHWVHEATGDSACGFAAPRVIPPAVPATPDAGDVEALAEELWADSPSPGAAPTDTERELARRILASDWLAARVSAAATKARAEERERIAQAIVAGCEHRGGRHVCSPCWSAAGIARFAHENPVRGT